MSSSTTLSSSFWNKELPSEWELVCLTGVLSFIVDNRGKSIPTSEEGIPLIATNCVNNNDLFPTRERIRYVNSETYNTWFKSYPLPGDILFVNKGTPGRVCLIPEKIDFCFAQDMVGLRANEEKIYNKYLLAVLRSPQFQEQVSAYSVGTMIPHCKKTDFDKLVLPLPPLDEQKKIGDLYYALSEKIEVNNAINKKLEEMAQAIFKQWFVDFEFPNEEGKPYKSSGGAMVESELGMIPEGWGVKQLGEITSIIIDHRGKTPKKLGGDWSDSGFKAISAKNIKHNRIVKSEDIKFLDEDMYVKWMSEPLKAGDVLMTSEAPLGELYYLAEEEEYCLSQRLYGLRSNENILLSPLFFMSLNSNQVIENIKNRATGTTVLGIRQSELRKVPMIVAPIEVQKQVAPLIEGMLKKIFFSEKESETLKNTRDTLLPKLMLGEIRVPVENE